MTREWAELGATVGWSPKLASAGNKKMIYEDFGIEQLGSIRAADGSVYATRSNRATWADWEKRSYAQPLGPQGVQFRRYDRHDRWQKTRAQGDALAGTHTRLSSFQRNERSVADDSYLMRDDRRLGAVRDFFEACGETGTDPCGGAHRVRRRSQRRTDCSHRLYADRRYPRCMSARRHSLRAPRVRS